MNEPAPTLDEEIARQASAATPPPPPPADPLSAERDSLGRPFDPAKFKPERDSVGRWKNLNAGRKSRAPAGGGTPPPADPAPADFSDIERAAGPAAPPPPPAADSARAELIDDNATADSVIGIIQTALVLIGDEEGILSDGEKILIRRPLVRILEKYQVGKDALPVEIDLALAMAGIVIARLQKPKTATFWAKAKAWAVGLWFRHRGATVAADVRRAVETASA